MSRKLLNKTLRFYVLFSAVVLIFSVPIFYFFTEKLFIEDADEALLLRKREFVRYNLNSLRTEDIQKWNSFNRDIKIQTPDLTITKDSIFYKSYIDTLANNENEPYRVLLSPFTLEGRPYLFLARINLVESEDMLKGIALLFFVILSVLLVGLYLITRRLSNRLWRPFYSTLNQIEKFELDKSSHPNFENSSTEEFDRLNQSVGKLLERNESVYKNQKEFIENAAHELKTPLATFQAKLDSLVQKIPFTQELGDTLSNLNDAASRLNRINKNLLLLSKIENDQFIISEKISVSDILRKQVELLKEQSEDQNVEINVKLIDEVKTVANETLLEIAIANLLVNALRHNKINGQVFISLYSNKLVVTNTGQAVPLNSEKLFDRFSHARSGGGNGLGLAITKKIADVHGWTLEYSFHDETHVFTVLF